MKCIRTLFASFCVAIAPSDASEVQLRTHELSSSLLLAVQALPLQSSPQLRPQMDTSLQMTRRSVAMATLANSPMRWSIALLRDLAANKSRWALSATISWPCGQCPVRIGSKPAAGIIDIQQSMEGSRFAFKYRLPAGRSVAQAEVDAHSCAMGTSTQSAVCSIPLMANDQCIAILSIRRNRRMGF